MPNAKHTIYASVNEVLIAAYPVVNVPSDQLISDPKVMAFYQWILKQHGHHMEPLAIIKRLITLRKKGELAKIRGGHGPPSGRKQGDDS